MNIVASLLDSTPATASIRRAIPNSYATVRGCRTGDALRRLLDGALVDAIVIGARSIGGVDLEALRRAYPVVPVVVFGPIKPDHGEMVRAWYERGVSAIAVEGVDDPVVGEIVMQQGYLHRRRRELRDLPRILRLTEPIQRTTLERLLGTVGRRPDTGALARSVGVSREHLSRQFAAGGAPNLKRVIDLLQILAARDRINAPGYPIDRLARLLGFAGSSHLRAVIRRLVRLPLRDFRRATNAELTRRFAASGMRSRP